VSERCPIGRSVEKDQCAERTCVYNVGGNCEYNSCSVVQELPLPADRLSGVVRIFGITEQEVQSSAREVMVAIVLSRYFEYLFGKSILDCKKKELEALRLSESQYTAWRGKPNPKFAQLLETLSKIEVAL